MKNRVITISREFGSGGRSIGKEVAKRLGIPCYDSTLVHKIAEESGFAENYIKNSGEDAPTRFLGLTLYNYSFGSRNMDLLWKVQQKVIMDLAEKGPCIIVGRCADHILREKADCLKVFIHADMEYRSKRIVEKYGERDDSPEKRLRDKDKKRAAYHNFYTDKQWGESKNYHVVLNSGELGIEKCVEVIRLLY
ncbi:cytidylate kinase-like family protein [Peptostreptococcus faecalis]|uniref:cytidylate kinase-like family protein n=1 Tax=Peptostreptococcus faecalis TaxID=2045015 RepID=UPI000C79D24D|nr:cytidylate kinase-like family protein [Peptostreptococcus faecalis]